MSKTTDVIFEKDKIVVSFKKLIKNQNVHLEFIPINQYQLSCNKIVIENKEKSTNINSTDLRKINIHNLVKTSIKLIDKNIRVNSLSPGGVFNEQPEDFVKRLSNLIPMGRMANRDEYKGAVVFLCSDASSYMTGENVVMNGGRAAW